MTTKAPDALTDRSTDEDTKIVVVYRTRYGSTKRYAETLAERLGAACMPLNDLDEQAWAEADRVIYGAPLRHGHILGAQRFLRRMEDRAIPFALFTTCIAPYEEETFKLLRERTLGDELEAVPLFYTRGIWDFEKMHTIDQLMVKGILHTIEKHDPEVMSLTERTLQSMGETREDHWDPGYLAPIIRWAEGKKEPGIGRGREDQAILKRVEAGLCTGVKGEH